jgi:rare lipoprotein A
LNDMPSVCLAAFQPRPGGENQSKTAISLRLRAYFNATPASDFASKQHVNERELVRQDSRGILSPLRVTVALAFGFAFVSFLQGCASLSKPKSHADFLGYKETGMASHYAKEFRYARTASGEPLNNNAMSAAHKTLPFGTKVVVKNLDNGQSVTVRINDRGPFVKGRIIDLTRAAFSRISSPGKGIIRVEVRVVK